MSKRKQYDDDDGRVIANMDVEGMPWNNGYNMITGGFFKKGYRKKIESEMQKNQQQDAEQLTMTKRETRMLILNAVVAVLLIAGVFALAAFLFILFCLNVWFK